MNIIIFGASGGTGRQLVIQGLKKGHHITAYVRNPDKFNIKNKKLLIIKGDISNIQDIQKAIKNQQVVISVLGNKTSKSLWQSNTVISDGLNNIILCMRESKVKRLIFVTSFGVNDNIFLPEKVIIKTLLKNLFADIPKQEELIEKSGLDWTLIRPARLVNNQIDGEYKVGVGLPIGLFSKISRSDVASYILNNLLVKNTFGKILTISN